MRKKISKVFKKVKPAIMQSESNPVTGSSFQFHSLFSKHKRIFRFLMPVLLFLELASLLLNAERALRLKQTQSLEAN